MPGRDLGSEPGSRGAAHHREGEQAAPGAGGAVGGGGGSPVPGNGAGPDSERTGQPVSFRHGAGGRDDAAGLLEAARRTRPAGRHFPQFDAARGAAQLCHAPA